MAGYLNYCPNGTLMDFIVFKNCLGAYATKLWNVAPPGLRGSATPNEGLRIAANPSYIVSPIQGSQGVLPTAAQMRRLVGLFASLTLKV